MLRRVLSFPCINGTWPKRGISKPRASIHEYLSGRVVDVVVSPDDVGYAHQRIIDDDGEIVGGRVVGPPDDQIVQFFCLERDLPTNEVVERDGPGERALETDDEWLVGILGGAVAARPVVGGLPSFGHRRLAFLLQQFGSAVTLVGGAFIEEAVGVLPVQLRPVRSERRGGRRG